MQTRPSVGILPPRPDHYPRVGDPIAVPNSGNSPLVFRYTAYMGDGRFAVITEDECRHVVRWDDMTGWTSFISWCRVR